MKKTHVIALVLLAAAVVAFALSSSDLTTFSSFGQASKSGKTVKVAGQLVKTRPMTYDPEKDPNYFSFFMTDDEGQVSEVVIREPKRRDFERSEQIVVTGRMHQDGHFEASEMLLKCPSKYKEEELALRKS